MALAFEWKRRDEKKTDILNSIIITDSMTDYNIYFFSFFVFSAIFSLVSTLPSCIYSPGCFPIFLEVEPLLSLFFIHNICFWTSVRQRQHLLIADTTKELGFNKKTNLVYDLVTGRKRVFLYLLIYFRINLRYGVW